MIPVIRGKLRLAAEDIEGGKAAGREGQDSAVRLRGQLLRSGNRRSSQAHGRTRRAMHMHDTDDVAKFKPGHADAHHPVRRLETVPVLIDKHYIERIDRIAFSDVLPEQRTHRSAQRLLSVLKRDNGKPRRALGQRTLSREAVLSSRRAQALRRFGTLFLFVFILYAGLIAAVFRLRLFGGLLVLRLLFIVLTDYGRLRRRRLFTDSGNLRCDEAPIQLNRCRCLKRNDRTEAGELHSVGGEPPGEAVPVKGRIVRPCESLPAADRHAPVLRTVDKEHIGQHRRSRLLLGRLYLLC